MLIEKEYIYCIYYINTYISMPIQQYLHCDIVNVVPTVHSDLKYLTEQEYISSMYIYMLECR